MTQPPMQRLRASIEAVQPGGLETPMSSRSIVALGLWILLMVLVGTMTVGVALAFYAAVTAFFAVLVGVLMVVTRHRDDREHRA